MSKKRNENEIEKVQGVDPNFLSKYIEQDDSLDSLKGYRIVPKLKIVQNTSASDLTSKFDIGSAIIRPGDMLVCEPNETFTFVPLFFFAEFCKWQDLKKSGDGPNVLERSFDPSSPTAKKARDPERRYEVYEGHENLPEKQQCKYRYVEHLRFIGIIYGEHDLAATPVTMSFERGEFGQGKNFISAVTLRRQRINDKPVPVPLWSQAWEFGTVFHDPDPSRKWYGFRFEPADPPLINPEDAEFLYSQHKEYKELFEKSRLLVDDEGEETADDPGSAKECKDF